MAKSRGLEKDGRRERIFGLGRGAAVQSFARESPCLLGISCALAGRQRMFGAVQLAEGAGFETGVRLVGAGLFLLAQT